MRRRAQAKIFLMVCYASGASVVALNGLRLCSATRLTRARAICLIQAVNHNQQPVRRNLVSSIKLAFHHTYLPGLAMQQPKADLKG